MRPADELAQSHRIYFMDALRAFLMTLGIVLHSTQLFNPERSWLISSSESADFAGYLVTAITTFRMPAFFIVSGFFCVWSLNKYAPGQFLRLRLAQVVIPFLVTAVVLNSIQTALLFSNGSLNFQFDEYLLQGGYISHLWFLCNLIVYFAVAGLVAHQFREPAARFARRLSRGFEQSPICLVLVVLPSLNIAVLVLNQLGFPLYSSFLGVWNTYNIFWYTPYFLFGLILGLSEKNLLRFAQFSPLLCALGLMLGVAGAHYITFDGGIMRKTIHVYCETSTVWCAAALCFQFFYRFANSPNRFSRLISEASYTVYLFHHGLVVAIGLLIMQLALPIIVQLMVLIASVSLITIGIHRYLIDRHSMLKLLFNGKFRPASAVPT